MIDRLCPQNGDGFCAVLSEEQVEQIRAYAKESYPRECCGILVGIRGDKALVWLVQPAENVDQTRAQDRYRIDPREILKADRAAETSGGEVIGFYHSHPDHPAAPSASDLEYAWPGYIYLIASVSAEGETEVRAWSYDEEQGRFHEQLIHVTRPVGASGGRQTL